jgi:hypothetical protein
LFERLKPFGLKPDNRITVKTASIMLINTFL